MPRLDCLYLASKWSCSCSLFDFSRGGKVEGKFEKKSNPPTPTHQRPHLAPSYHLRFVPYIMVCLISLNMTLPTLGMDQDDREIEVFKNLINDN